MNTVWSNFLRFPSRKNENKNQTDKYMWKTLESLKEKEGKKKEKRKSLNIIPSLIEIGRQDKNVFRRLCSRAIGASLEGDLGDLGALAL